MKKICFVSLLVAACSSSGPAPFDRQLTTASDGRGETVGVRDDSVYIQKKIYLEEQLWALKSEVDDLQKSIYGSTKQDPSGIYLGLKECRKRVADPRVGGSGKPEPMETWVNITRKDEAFFYQVDKKTNSLIGVNEEALDDRIHRYRAHRNVLETKYDEMKDKLEACEDNYRTALVQHGLNPDDTKAQGEWVDGPNGYKVWRMKRTATKDPEELMRRKAAREETDPQG